MSSIHRLDEVCELVMGQAPDGDAYNTSGNGWPLIAGAGDFGDVYPAPKKFTTEASKLSQTGDIVLGIRASIGEKVLSDGVYCLGRGVVGLRAKSALESRYLWHWLSHVRRQLASKAKGATFKQVNREDIGEFEIRLPSVPEQRRIAEVLDRAEALRAKRRESLAQLDSLNQAIFIDLFGDPATNPKIWPRATLGDLITVGPQNGLYKPSSDYGSGTPILRIDTFYAGKVKNIDELKRVRVSKKERDLYGLQVGEIVINRVNSMEYLGKSALVPVFGEPTVFESNMMRFDVDREQVEPGYIVQFLQTGFIKSEILTASKNAVNQSSINQQDVKGFRINVPPLSLQREFAHRVAAVEKQKATHRASLAEMDALFASLQFRAFRGEL